MIRYSRIGVFCGAKPAKPAYLDLARDLGTWLGRHGIGLVYGGGGTGLMGAVAEAAHLTGSHVTGVMPHHLLGEENPQPHQIQLFVVRTMHERKALMYQLSQAFVALPGGMGTLDELMEVSTWAKLGLHSKPVLVLNHDGFFDNLLSWLDLAVREGMMTAAEREVVQDVGSLDALAAVLAPAESLVATA